MAIQSPLDELLRSDSPVGDIAREPNVSLPGEFPEETNERVFKEQQRKAQIRAIKGRELAARGIPSFVDPSGEVQPVRDERGVALNRMVKGKSIAFDSTGTPRKLVFGETGEPSLEDPFADLPTRTDKKTGAQTKSITGVGSIQVGTDPAIAERARLAAQDKEIGQLSTTLGRKLSLDERDFKLATKDLEKRSQALIGSVPTLAGAQDPTPEDATRLINEHFDRELKTGKANKRTGWFGFGDPTEEAKTAQSEIEQRRQAALRASSELFGVREQLTQRRAAVESLRESAKAAARQRAELKLEQLRAMGIDVPESADALPENPQTGELVEPPAIARPKDDAGNVIGSTPQADAADALAKLESVPAAALPEIDAGEQWDQTKWTDFVPFLGTARDIADLATVGAAAARLQDDTASQEDLALLKDFVDRESRDKTFGAKVLSVLTALPAFAGELLATSGIYSAGAKVGKEAGKAALQSLLSKSGRELLESKVAQFGVKAMGATAGTLAQFVPAGGLRWAEQTMERMLPGMAVDENERGELVGAITREGDDFTDALRKAGGDTFVELLSERTGGALKFLPGVDKLAGLKAGFMKRWFAQNPGAPASAFTSFLNKAGWHGVVGEMFEERVGDVLRGVGAAGEAFADGRAGEALDAFVKDAVPSLEQLAVEGVAFAIPGAGIAAYSNYKGQQFQKELANVAQSFQEGDAALAQMAANPGELTPQQQATVTSFAKRNGTAAGFIVGQHKQAGDEAIETIAPAVNLQNEERADASEFLNEGGDHVFIAQAIGADARQSGQYDAEVTALDRQLQDSGVELPARREAIINHTLGSVLVAKTVNEVAAGKPVTRTDVLDQLTKAGVVTVIKGPAGQRDIFIDASALEVLPTQIRQRVAASGNVTSAVTGPNTGLAQVLTNGRTAIRNVAAAISPWTPGENVDQAIANLFADPVDQTGAQPSVEPQQGVAVQGSTTEPPASPAQAEPADNATQALLTNALAGGLAESLERMGWGLDLTTGTPRGMEAHWTPEGHLFLRVDLVSLAPILEMTSDPASFFEKALDEEMTHLAGLEAVRRAWEARGRKSPDGIPETYEQAFAREYGQVAASLTEKQIQFSRDTYGDQTLSGPNLAAEFVRQLSQMDRTQMPTEGFLREFIDRILAVLSELLENKADWSSNLRKAFDDTNRVYEEAQATNTRESQTQRSGGSEERSDLPDSSTVVASPLSLPDTQQQEQPPLEQRIATSVGELEALIADPARALQESIGPAGIPIISADDFVARTSAMRESSMEDGPEVYAALKPLADLVRQATFEFALTQPPRDHGEVVLTAGGPGSGKSTVARTDQGVDFIYDSILGNVETAREYINAILLSGRAADITLVVRDPAEAMFWNLVRAMNEKRVASAEGLTKAHVDARNTVKELAAIYAGNRSVSFRAYENSTGELPKLMNPAAVPALDLDQTLEAVHRVLNGIAEGTDAQWANGPLPPSILAAARSGQGESREDVQRDVGEVGSEDSGSEGEGNPASRSDSGALTGDVSKLPKLGPLQLPAHHGTPHKVDKFSTEKIGTGEGAQVYGWGLYFAENEAVARNYRDSLAPRDSHRGWTYNGKPLFDVSHPDPTYSDEEKAASYVASEMVDNGLSFKAAVAQNKQDNAEAEFINPKAFDLVQESKLKAPGNTYTVELDVDQDELLDWDKPLGEQSEKVRTILLNLNRFNDLDTGKEIYKSIADNFGEKEASEILLSRGIPGIKYLDQGSRFSPHPNFKVEPVETGWAVFDNNGNRLLTYPTEKDARDALAKEAKHPTYNYVIFDESRIRITHENGVPVEQPNADELPPQVATDAQDPLRHDGGSLGLPPSLISDSPTPEFRGKKVATREAINAMADILTAAGKNVPIRTGRIAQRNFLGIWKDFPEVIRMKTANDVATAAHEVGHGLQKVVYKSVKSSALKTLPPAVKSELLKLGRALYGSTKPNAGYTAEGFAEFVRTFLTQDNAALVAPATHDFLINTVLPTFPEVNAAFNRAKDVLNQFRAQGKQNKVSADIVDPKSAKVRLARLKAMFSRGELKRTWVDEFEPLRELVAEAEVKLGRKLEIEEDGYRMAAALRGVAPHKVQYMAEKGMIDLNSSIVGPSLNEVLDPVRDRMDEFMLYLWAEHALERWADGKNPGMEQDEAQFLVDTLGADPKFQRAAQGYWDWNQGLMNYVSQASPGLKPLIEKITAKWKKYVPLARWFEPAEVKTAVSELKAGGDANTVLKRVTEKGSGRAIIEPMPVILKNAEKWVELAHKRMILDTVLALSGVPGMGYRIEQVPKGMEANTVTIGQVRSALNKMGVDTDHLDDAEALTFFTPMVTPKGSDPIISHTVVNSKGEPETRWFQVDPRLFDALEGVNLYRLPKALDLLLGVPARLFRLGTTGLRASFSMFTNPARDLPSFLMQSQSQASSRQLLGAWMRSFAELWNPKRLKGKHAPLIDMFDRLGMQVGQPLGIDLEPLKQPQNRSVAGKVMHKADNLLEALRGFLSITESAPRIAELREIAKEVGWDWENAAPMTTRQMLAIMLATKQVTVDFSAAGELSKKINQAVPFFNATIQGARAFARAWQRNPSRAMLRGASLLTVPALLLWWSNKDEEWYQDLPWRDRFLYFNIPFGDQLVQIPRPMEWGNFFSTVPEALFDSVYREDPEAFKQAFGHIFESSNPADFPVLLRAAKEQWQNRTEFFDRPIVPRSETDLPPGEQRSPYTSGLAKWLGDQFPNTVSPRRVDAAVRALTGGALGDFVKDVETLGKAIGAIPSDREPQPSDLPFIGRAWNKGGKDSGDSLAVQKFYDELDKANGRARSLMRPETETDRVRRMMLRDAHKALKVLTMSRMLTKTLEQEQAINRRIREVATDAIKLAPAASNPDPVPYDQAKQTTKEKPKGPIARPKPFQPIIEAGKKTPTEASRMFTGF